MDNNDFQVSNYIGITAYIHTCNESQKLTRIRRLKMADLTDDYVAQLLAKDAKESSIKYSTVGMEAFTACSKYVLRPNLTLLTNSHRPVNKPKPNTRFLRNIIKDTDSHNAALLAKEAAESKARLMSLETKEKRAGADIRKRQLGHITAHLTGGFPRRDSKSERPEKRKRGTTKSDDEADARGRRDREGPQESGKRSHVDDRSIRSKRLSRNSDDNRRRSRSKDRSEKHRDERHRKSRARSRSPTREHRDREDRHRHRSSSRRAYGSEDENDGRSRRRRRSRSPGNDDRSRGRLP